MKILFVQPTGDKRGHYGVYTVHLCQELAKIGHEVTLFTNKVHPEKFIKEKPLFKIIEAYKGKYIFEVFDLQREKHPLIYIYGYFRNSFYIVRAALKFAQKNSFDVVQVLDAEYAILSLLVWRYRKQIPPIVLFVQAANFSFSTYSGSVFSKCYKVIQKFIFKNVIGNGISAFVVLGEYHKEELTKQLNFPSVFPVQVIYDGATPPSFFTTTQKARQAIELDYQGPLFLFFGILRKDKGIEYLFEAVSLLGHKDFKLLVAGSCFDYTTEQIAQLIFNWKIKEKVITHLSYIEDEKVPFYFYAANAVVFPYRKLYTGGSGPLLKEAAIYKTPIIATNVSEMGRLLQQYSIGLLADPENAQSLADAMDKFLTLSPQQKQQLVENAYRVANTWPKMAQDYSAFYQKILA